MDLRPSWTPHRGSGRRSRGEHRPRLDREQPALALTTLTAGPAFAASLQSLTIAAASLSGDRMTYPPLDVLKPVAEGIWIVDSGPLRVLGLPLPVRMTVIRLSTGELLLHSPTRFDEDLRREMERRGRIRHLVAPNSAHWCFLRDWQRNCPDAVAWAVPGLHGRRQVRKSGVRLDRDLTEAPPHGPRHQDPAAWPAGASVTGWKTTGRFPYWEPSWLTPSPPVC